ncbi:MAG: DMT family transporter, partial [Fimbriimonadaceae bacterium]
VMVLWGFNFVALKLLMQDGRITAGTAALGRWVLMTAFLFAYCRWKGISLKMPSGDHWRVHLQGFLSMGVYMVLFTLGMSYAAPAEGAIILGCSPVFTLLLAVAFKQERFRLAILLGTLLAFSGVGLVVLTSPDSKVGSDELKGDALLFISAFVWALGTVISRPLVSKMNPIAMTTLAMPAALLALLPFGITGLSQTHWSQVSMVEWSMLLYFALFAGAIGFMGFYTGVRKVGAAGAMLYQYFVAPLAAISSLVFLHKGLVVWQLFGLAVVIVGVWLANQARLQHARATEA